MHLKTESELIVSRRSQIENPLIRERALGRSVRRLSWGVDGGPRGRGADEPGMVARAIACSIVLGREAFAKPAAGGGAPGTGAKA